MALIKYHFFYKYFDPISFLLIPFVFDSAISLRIFDLLSLGGFFYVIFKPSLARVNHHLFLISLVWLFASLGSYFGLTHFSAWYSYVDINLHLKNIMMSSFRILQIIFLSSYFTYRFNVGMNMQSLLAKINLAFFYSFVLSIALFLIKIANTGNSPFAFILSGRYIHNNRFSELTGSVNGSGFLVGVSIPIFLYIILNCSNKLLAYANLILATSISLLTGSKMAILPYLFMVIYYFIPSVLRLFLKFKIKLVGIITLIIIATILCLSFSFLPASYTMRFSTFFAGKEKGSTERLVRTSVGLSVLNISPLVGIGNSSVFTHLYSLNAPLVYQKWARGVGAHNFYITQLVRTGLLGLFAFLFLSVYSSIRYLSKIIRDKNDLLIPFFLSSFLFLHAYSFLFLMIC